MQVGYGLEWTGVDRKGKAGGDRYGTKRIGRERQVWYGLERTGVVRTGR